MGQHYTSEISETCTAVIHILNQRLTRTIYVAFLLKCITHLFF